MARPATADDAIDAIEAIRQSITILCEPDHHNRADTLDRWLANKSPDSFRAWISDPDNYCVVEEAGGKVQGVGLLRRSGELQLFYVAPGYERRGIGGRIHAAMMSQAKRWGLTKVHLESTSVARRFYESLGYRSTGAEGSFLGFQVFPYELSCRMKAEQSIQDLVAALVGQGLQFERIASAPWIESLESRLGFALPKSLRQLAMNYSYPTIELGTIELFSNLGDGSDDELSVAPFLDRKLHEWLQKNGKLQFARLASASYDPVCVNAHEKHGRAVEQLDHEDILLSRGRVRSTVLAESLEEMLRLAAAAS